MSKRTRDAEDLKKRIQLKALLKKVVREVIINNQWLDGDNDDDTKISSNAKKNIALLVRTKRKVGMLTATEKSLIRTPHLLRTICDRKKLSILFAGLRCFYLIPPKLRARLVPVIKFISLSKGRTIMRQGDLPITVFFIVTGEVQMIKTTTSESSRKMESKGEIVFGPGDCIGDVEMTEDCARTHSFITTSQSELLVLFGDDYNSILKTYMKKIWNEKKKALKALDYFDFLNEDQVLKACKLCSLKQFKPLDTIYSQDKGTLSNVHFVLSGECVILQCLNMKKIIRNGKKEYELVDTFEESTFNINSDSEVEKKSNIVTNLSDHKKRLNKMSGKFTLKDMELACRTQNQSSIDYPTKIDLQEHIECQEYCEEEMNFLEEEIAEIEIHSKGSFSLDESEKGSMLEVSYKKNSTESEIFTLSSSLGGSLRTNISRDNYESHFIDVGSITFGGIFGLGEKTQHRVIMARDTVQCLTLPRLFLLDSDQNPGNIWQRRLFYLECIIPSRESLFENFMKTLQWKKFKYNFIQQTLKSNTNDVARDDDVPILCRIEEGRENY